MSLFSRTSEERRFFNITPPDILTKSQMILGIKIARTVVMLAVIGACTLFAGKAVSTGLNFGAAYLLKERDASLERTQAYVNKLGGREGSKQIAEGEKIYGEWDAFPAGKTIIEKAFEGVSYFKVFPLDYFGYRQKGNDLTVNIAVALDAGSPKDIQDKFFSILETLRTRGWDVKYDSWGGNIGLLVTMTSTVGNI